MEQNMVLKKLGDDFIDLPPGFRFHPTDEEIITHYLQHRAINNKFTAYAISEVDLNRVEPWEMPNKAKMGEKEWYFFCQKDRKYPTGTRTNRATKSGYWKATGKDKEIYKGKGSHRPESIIGMKKTLVFYMGRAPKGEKTNWVMHEYRLEGKFPQYYKLSKDEWVVCRVFHKTTGIIKRGPVDAGHLVNSFIDDMIEENSPPPPLMDPSTPSGGGPSSSSFTDCGGDYEHKMKASTDEFKFPTSTTNYYCPPTYTNNNNYSMMSPSPFITHCSFQRHQNMLGLDQCKVEYSSNNNNINMQGSVSQNTGISTDANNATPEISSVVVSKQEIMNSNEISNMMMLNKELEMDGLADLDCLWDF